MQIPSRVKAGRRGSTLVLFTLMLPTMLIPLAGLGIDATMLYIVQAKLAAAVDGSALGAGRLLGTLASPNEIAGEFLNANFRANGTMGFWGAFNLTPTISVSLGTTKSVHVTATADVPLLFARIFGFPTARVSAAAMATRRDSRVVLVIDRSGSMTKSDGSGSTVIQDVIDYSQSFTQDFTPGVDEVGLVAFDGSGVVGYPPIRPWDSTTTNASTGGPDTAFMSGSNTDMLHQIRAITANSGTGIGDALSIAYIELQKAHMKDLLAKGVDDKLNSIVLFTDGVPSAVSLFLNNPANNNADNVISSTSGCNYKDIRTTNTTQKMLSWLAITGPAFSGSGGFGMYLLASIDPNASHTATWWMANGGSDASSPSPNSPNAPYTGCTGLMNDSSISWSYFTKIPNYDMWGNNLMTTAYQNSHVVGGSVSSIYTHGKNLTYGSSTQKSDDYYWGLAIWNAADSAALRIRTDANLANRPGDTQNMAVAIYTIAYTGNGGTDDGLLRRIANDKSAAGYDAGQPTGLYVQASDSGTLSTAFSTIASAILRLAQ
jgi:von Willebrand factor type A domain/Putative Flp pilus-assembly TadE/G-like/Putative Tad-like Flp pilus-assembly